MMFLFIQIHRSFINYSCLKADMAASFHFLQQEKETQVIGAVYTNVSVKNT